MFDVNRLESRRDPESDTEPVGDWRGVLLGSYIAETAGVEMHELDEAELVVGHGIVGDRYASRRGHYSHLHRPDREVTLIESEVLVALERDHNISLTGAETRRNLLTRGVPLGHLVGRHFSVGEVVLYADRLNVPCMYLERLIAKPVFNPLINRSGLNCQIIVGGRIRPGDEIRPVEPSAVLHERTQKRRRK